MTEEFNGVRKIVHLDTLRVDDAYQRGLKPHHKRIAKKFDAFAAGELVVNQRADHSLWVIDGQQRVGAMKILGIKQWPARVLALATVKEEAAVFGRINGNEGTTCKISEKDKFKAARVAEEPVTMGAIAAVAAGGMLLGEDRHRTKWPNIVGTSTVLTFYRAHGGEKLTTAIRLIVAAWNGDDDAVRYDVVETVTRFVLKYPDADYDRAAKQFSSVAAIKVAQRADNKDEGKTSRYLAAVYFLARLYNRRLIKNRLWTPDEGE